jgi:diguanylate cyclase (GGDEF)-like protein/PAS domain S-box-containing protein
VLVPLLVLALSIGLAFVLWRARARPGARALALTLCRSFLRLVSVDRGLGAVARDAVVEGMGDGVLVLDRDLRTVDVNPAAARFIGRPAADLFGQRLTAVFPGLLAVEHLNDDAGEIHRELAIGSGRARREYDLLISPLQRQLLGPSFRLLVLRDLTEPNRAQAALRESENRYRSVVNAVHEVIYQTDAGGRWRLLNPAWTAISGHIVQETLGTWLVSYVHPDDRALAEAQHELLVSGRHSSASYEVRFLTEAGQVRRLEANARPLFGEDGRIVGTTGTLKDVTERKALEEQLAHQAYHDTLTGLANRALFYRRVSQALAQSHQTHQTVGIHAVLLLDLDNFKNVNDSLGHGAGDALLVAVAERLAGSCRPGDTVTRLGGDEFAVLLEDLPSSGQAAATAERMLAELRAPIALQGTELFVGASIGIASSDQAEDGSSGGETGSAETLIRQADVALYLAKRQGRGRASAFEPGMDSTTRERLALEADLHRALERDELVLAYQPIVELASGRLTGLEALVRWQHPTRGLLQPAAFIPLAEESGLIAPLGRWVLRTACLQARAWASQGASGRLLSMSVNVAARQLRDPRIEREVAGALAAAELDPDCLTLEITETAAMQNLDSSIERLGALKRLGVHLALDDFGTGYSSLNYLRRFPVDILKIDRAFISGIQAGGDDAALARGIVQLARALRLTTVAEGIEQPDQLGQLQEMGCERGQGYLFARPLPPAAIQAILNEGANLTPPSHAAVQAA